MFNTGGGGGGGGGGGRKATRRYHSFVAHRASHQKEDTVLLV